eukprot:1626442-Rhodomonas_salina.4
MSTRYHRENARYRCARNQSEIAAQHVREGADSDSGGRGEKELVERESERERERKRANKREREKRRASEREQERARAGAREREKAREGGREGRPSRAGVEHEGGECASQCRVRDRGDQRCHPRSQYRTPRSQAYLAVPHIAYLSTAHRARREQHTPSQRRTAHSQRAAYVHRIAIRDLRPGRLYCARGHYHPHRHRAACPISRPPSA